MTSQDAKPTARGRETIESAGPPASDTSLSGSTPQKTSLDRVAEPPSENTPLLSASSSGEDETDGLLDGQTEPGDDDQGQSTKSIWYLIFLTISIGGLQIAWSVELSNGSPFLLSLGISKSLMALVWIAGPLSGTLVQPYVGIRSDNCRISSGRRKPFMLAGSVATIISLMALAWTREWAGALCVLLRYDVDAYETKIAIITFAVLFVYVLDFAINTGKFVSSLSNASQN